jgi:hypothetical protein
VYSLISESSNFHVAPLRLKDAAPTWLSWTEGISAYVLGHPHGVCPTRLLPRLPCHCQCCAKRILHRFRHVQCGYASAGLLLLGLRRMAGLVYVNCAVHSTTDDVERILFFTHVLLAHMTTRRLDEFRCIVSPALSTSRMQLTGQVASQRHSRILVEGPYDSRFAAFEQYPTCFRHCCNTLSHHLRLQHNTSASVSHSVRRARTHVALRLPAGEQSSWLLGYGGSSS